MFLKAKQPDNHHNKVFLVDKSMKTQKIGQFPPKYDTTEAATSSGLQDLPG